MVNFLARPTQPRAHFPENLAGRKCGAAGETKVVVTCA